MIGIKFYTRFFILVTLVPVIAALTQGCATKQKYKIISKPEKVEVLINGQAVGETPIEKEFVFEDEKTTYKLVFRK